MASNNWSDLASELTDTLHLGAPPLAITFSDAPPDGVAPYEEPMPDALPASQLPEIVDSIKHHAAADAVVAHYAADDARRFT